MRVLEPECVGDANDELAHRPRRQQRIATLGMTEPRQVDRHQMGVLGESRPGRFEREQALRPRAQQEGVIVPVLALGEADGQPVDRPELRLDGCVSTSASSGEVSAARGAFASASGQCGGQSSAGAARAWAARRRRWSVAGRTRSSWLRELMSSLMKTLRRWYWTVRGLMNSRVPISGFESPSRASRAIWASWAVSSSRVSTRALAGGLAGGQQLAAGPLGERLDAHRRQHLVGGAQLLARVDAPVLASQPLAVEQMARGRAPRGRGYGRGARSTRGRDSRRPRPR